MSGFSGETRKLIKAARRQHWQIYRTGGDHLLFVSPAGEQVFVGSTPRGGRSRSWLNERAQLRRAKLKI